MSLKKKWLEALRSGKYKQTQGRLRHPTEGYCCLGLLAEVHEDFSWLPSLQILRGDDGYVCGEVLPLDVLSQDVQDKLTSLNDNKLWSFEKIADYIKAHASEDLKTWKA